jgi:hypothetical protein
MLTAKEKNKQTNKQTKQQNTKKKKRIPKKATKKKKKKRLNFMTNRMISISPSSTFLNYVAISPLHLRVKFMTCS